MSAPRYGLRLVREGEPTRQYLSDADDAMRFAAEQISDRPQEVLLFIGVTAKNEIIGTLELSVGDIGATLVPIRAIFQAALLMNADGFFIAHNHPSGDPTPSQQDLDATKRIKEVAELMDFRFYDHIIVGDIRNISLQREGKF